MATPHISAPTGAFAQTVLMPGDPLRAKYIAETFLDGAEQVTAVRNMYGYTGAYKGKRISVMGHGMGASTDSNVNRIRFHGYDFAALADFGIVRALDDAARARNINAKVGALFSSDLFYHPDAALTETLRKYRVFGVEMEAAGLYGVAAEFGAKAATVCTVSDHIVREEFTSAEERQTTFNEMIQIALDAAATL